ncbi:MAG: hypothetical protein VX278_01030 [Myxococcota bacterium]|nr:hypothetical protein [Myxococcota bacterium]
MLFFSWLISTGHANPIQSFTNPLHPLSCTDLQKRGLIIDLDDCSAVFDDAHRWKRGLKEKGIHVFGQAPTSLLSYLYSYFSYVSSNESLSVRIADVDGPKRVWKEGQTLFFSQNAVDTLIDHQLHALINARETGAFTAQTAEFEIGYNNTLFEQLNQIFLDREQAILLLARHHGLRILDGAQEEHQPFSAQELRLIVKNLADLPPHILGTLRLKEIARAAAHKPLFHGSRQANAIYEPKKQRITLSDSFFDTQLQHWHSTFLHEIGHALWMNLARETQTSFIDLSFQERFHLSNWKPKSNACFISAYATESPEEDFAEHFAAFIEEPSLLQNRCPNKYAQFQEFIFGDIRYTSEAHENAAIFIDSHNPDSDPPVLRKPVSRSIQAEMKAVTEDEMELFLDAKWLYDAHSGVRELCLRFENPQGEVIQEYLDPTHRVDEQRGHYQGRILLERHRYSSSRMNLVTVISHDRAGNMAVHPVDDDLWISIPGKKDLFKAHPTEPLPSDLRQIQQTFVGKESGESMYDILIPVARHAGLHRITLDWMGQAEDARISLYHHTLADDDGSISLFQRNQQFMAKIRIRVPKHMNSGRYWLTNVHVEYEKDEGFVAHSSNIPLPYKGHRTLALELHNSDEDNSQALLNPNMLRLNTQDHAESNRVGGEKSILLHVPISGIDNGQLNAHIYMTAPSGKSLAWYITPHSEGIKKSGDMYTIELPLDPHHEKGLYILDEIDFVEDYGLSDYHSDQIVFRSHNHQYKVRFKERGIRKTVTVREDLHDGDHL